MEKMADKILICSDLDRTIIPNGTEPESPQARPLLRSLAENEHVVLAYVSGRGRKLLEDAIVEYELPVPKYAVGDVGTTIYAIENRNWTLREDWHAEIAPDWKGRNGSDLAKELEGIGPLTPQEPHRQGPYKLSYYVDPVDRNAILKKIKALLQSLGVEAATIWSVEEERNVGLLDILPRSATKLHAVRFLMAIEGVGRETTVFGGDSGNDLRVLTSDLQTVLVRNAKEEVRREAVEILESRGMLETLYLPAGGFKGMNGNYAAGLLEGVSHFLPELKF